MTKSLTAATMAAGLCAGLGTAHAQDRPFVFSLTTAADTSRPQVRLDYDMGVGERAFHQDVENRPEQRIGIQASVGRLTFVGRVGVASVGDSYQSSQQGELLVSLFTQAASGAALAIGGGVLHEGGGTDVLLGRIVAGREGNRMRIHGNLLFQKPLRTDRDRVDLITTVGWAARLNRTWSLGVEAIGEDLEGFLDENEAEGGARMLVGPSIHVARPQGRWQLSLAGGPTFHPTSSARASDARRDLPPTSRAYGYAFRTTFACNF